MPSYLTDSLLISLRPVQIHGAQLGKLLMIVVYHVKLLQFIVYVHLLHIKMRHLCCLHVFLEAGCKWGHLGLMLPQAWFILLSGERQKCSIHLS